jgi:outer membrane protein TolC
MAFCLCVGGFSPSAYGSVSFRELMGLASGNQTVTARRFEMERKQALVRENSRWKDPVLKLDAINFPADHAVFGRTPMSSIGVSVSQAFPVSGHLSAQSDRLEFETQGAEASIRELVRFQRQNVWNILIQIQRAGESQSVLNQNLAWLDQMVKISEKRYTTAGGNQEAQLAIRGKRLKTASLVRSTTLEIQRLWSDLASSVEWAESSMLVDLSSVPWKWLDQTSPARQKVMVDPTEEKLIAQKRADDKNRIAARRSIIPDITLSVMFRHREPTALDAGDDFVGASIMVPIPVFGKRQDIAQVKSALFRESEAKLKSYQRARKGSLVREGFKLEELLVRFQSLSDEEIPLARAKRDIAVSNYRVGKTDYVALLQSQLEVVDLEMQRIQLLSKIRSTKVLLLILSGNPLFELKEMQ